MENQSNNVAQNSRKWKVLPKDELFFKWFYFILAILLFMTLPFHYDLDDFNVFPKDNLSFNHTFFRDKEINKMIDEYNNAPLIEKNEIASRPFYRTLMENGYISDKKDTTANQGN